MDNYDKQILDIIQSHFPLAPRPYEEVGKQVGLSEDEVLERVRDLKKSRHPPHGREFHVQSTGLAVHPVRGILPEDKLDEFVAEVNKHDGVTHNYLRENEFNVWFALIAPNMDEVERILTSITEATGVKVLNLPAEKLFKIKVDFKMEK